MQHERQQQQREAYHQPSEVPFGIGGDVPNINDIHRYDDRIKSR
jgi:hypothetical protein